MRLSSRTGIEGPPVSSLNCNRPLHSGLKPPELVMDAGCRDNRWTASLYARHHQAVANQSINKTLIKL